MQRDWIKEIGGKLTVASLGRTNLDPTVTRINDEAIQLMMAGKTTEAANKLLQALQMSGINKEPRARTLINIGDYIRRIEGNLELASFIFGMVSGYALQPVLESRLLSMWAMVYSYRSEQGESDPDGIQMNIGMLKRAILVIEKELQSTYSEAAIRAKSLAVHRWAGTVCSFGTLESRKEVLPFVESLLNEVDGGSDESLRLAANRAIIIGDNASDISTAVHILSECARKIAENSPLDACLWFIKAGEFCLAVGKFTDAHNFYTMAQKFRDRLGLHKNTTHIEIALDSLGVQTHAK
jgi:hypothetical protein